MKVCILTTSFPRWNEDTAAPFVYDFGKKLVENGIEVQVVAPHDTGSSKNEIMDGMNVNRFQYMWPKKLQKLAYHGGIPYNLQNSFFSKILIPFFIFFFVIKGLKISKKCDIIHAQWMLPGIIGSFISKFSNKPVVLTILGSGAALIQNSSLIKNQLLRNLLDEIDLITLAYDYERDMLKFVFGDEKMIVIPIGVDINIFKREAFSSDLKKKLKIEGDFMAINACRLSKDYNVDVFIKAIPHVIKKIENVKFILLASGPLEEEMKNLVKKLNIDNFVIFIGGIPHEDVPNFLATSDIFVETFYEPGSDVRLGIGQATREAMACEVPQLLPDWIPKIKGISDHAIFYKTMNPKGLSEEILNLLKNEKLRLECGEKSRQIIKNTYDTDKIIKKWIKIYQDLLEEKK
ncbi:MAG: glycosyltransferase family 4 protein [Thermoplasmatales archaeon]|nr:glycosyltransferase family 4 protein [Thermoplasmatales archaeon]